MKGTHRVRIDIRPVSPSSRPRLQARRATRIRLSPLARVAAVVGITVAIVWWAAAQRATQRNPAVPAVTRPAPAPSVPAPAAPAEPQGAPLQLRNPFDATEVFEFPAGTSKTEAREAVAARLLDRARDRGSSGVGIKHAGSRRPARGAADESPGVPNSEMHTPK